MMSSVMPSEKYSCSASPLMFAKGNTAIDGFCGSGLADRVDRDPCSYRLIGPRIQPNAMSRRTGRAMFLTCCSPMSSNEKSSLSRTSSRTTRLTYRSPGSAKLRDAPRHHPRREMSSSINDDVARSDRCETRYGALAGPDRCARPFPFHQQRAHAVERSTSANSSQNAVAVVFTICRWISTAQRTLHQRILANLNHGCRSAVVSLLTMRRAVLCDLRIDDWRVCGP